MPRSDLLAQTLRGDLRFWELAKVTVIRLTARDVLWTQRPLPQVFAVGDIVYVRVLSLGPTFLVRVSLEEARSLITTEQCWRNNILAFKM